MRIRILLPCWIPSVSRSAPAWSVSAGHVAGSGIGGEPGREEAFPRAAVAVTTWRCTTAPPALVTPRSPVRARTACGNGSVASAAATPAPPRWRKCSRHRSSRPSPERAGGDGTAGRRAEFTTAALSRTPRGPWRERAPPRCGQADFFRGAPIWHNAQVALGGCRPGAPPNSEHEPAEHFECRQGPLFARNHKDGNEHP
jgi:hypothetical protein